MQKRDYLDLLVQVAKICKKLRIPYFVTGGIAVITWGRPRVTADIDMIVGLQHEHVDRFEKALRALKKTSYMSRHAIEGALLTGGEFNFIDSDTGVKVDFWIAKDDPFGISRMKRKRTKIIRGERVNFISPEDLILTKLQWGQKSVSTRHFEDALAVVAISKKQLDMRYLNYWARKLGLEKSLEKLMSESTNL